MENWEALNQWKNRLHTLAEQAGLDFYEMVYEVVPDDVMYMFASYGMPNRFSHWRFGKRFFHMQRMRKTGEMKIYELVLNTNPCYAFLLADNSLLENKLIIAHVLGHSDFFKNNRKFQGTNENVLGEMAFHARKIEEYEYQYGFEAVENAIDVYFTLEDQPNVLDVLKRSDVVTDWQRDIWTVLQKETVYFRPIQETKIMNEGWATYWHARLMHEILVEESEVLAFAKMHAGVVRPSPNHINPYLLGFRIFSDIEKRFGRERMFEVREVESDVTFLRAYFTEEIAHELNMYVYQPYGEEANRITHTSFEEVKERLIASVGSENVPRLTARYEEEAFVIEHTFDGRKMNMEHLKKVLGILHPYTGKDSIRFQTIVNPSYVTTICWDGKEHMYLNE